MTKTASAGLITHLAQAVTTVALGLKIVRKDGQEFNFTSLDDNRVIGGRTYYSTVGVTRSAVVSNASLSVDNTDIVSLIDDSIVTVHDLEGGLFNNAVAELFLYNWADVSMGTLRLRYGWLGEIVRSKLRYQTDITGLLKVLLKSINEIYSLRCRAELGDLRCKAVLVPALWQASTAYALKAAVEPTAGKTLECVLANPSAERNDLYGWTSELGSFNVRSASPTAFEGTYYFAGGVAAECKQYQDVALPVSWNTAVDAGNVTVNLSWVEQSLAAEDQCQMEVECRNVGGGILATFSSALNVPGTSWVAKSASGAVPAATRSFRVRMRGVRLAGGTCDSYFDAVRLRLTSTVLVTGAFDDRRMVATTAGTSGGAQPSWNLTIDGTTTDNTVTWTTKNAFRKKATVTRVVSNRIFDVGGMADAPSGYFSLGLATFTSGNNSGLSFEVAVSGVGSITLFEGTPFDIAVGDTVNLFIGCDKTPEKCKLVFDNMVNYRGEPHVPGQDTMLQVEPFQ